MKKKLKPNKLTVARRRINELEGEIRRVKETLEIVSGENQAKLACINELESLLEAERQKVRDAELACDIANNLLTSEQVRAALFARNLGTVKHERDGLRTAYAEAVEKINELAEQRDILVGNRGSAQKEKLLAILNTVDIEVVPLRSTPIPAVEVDVPPAPETKPFENPSDVAPAEPEEPQQ
jgi:archaellum component FlaC